MVIVLEELGHPLLDLFEASSAASGELHAALEKTKGLLQSDLLVFELCHGLFQLFQLIFESLAVLFWFTHR